MVLRLRLRYFCWIVIALLISATALTFAGKAQSTEKSLSTTDEGIPLPILMYHHILEPSSRWGDCVISPTQFEQDMTYLKEHGYTTIFTQELIDYFEKGSPLPPKPVIVSFDDGYRSNLEYALPILEKLDMKAVISVVGRFTEEYASPDYSVTYAQLSWDDIGKLIDSGRIEIGNHTYNMHYLDKGRKGTKRLPGESMEAYTKALQDDIGHLQDLLQEHNGIRPNVFAFPFGFISDGAVDILKGMGFQALFTCANTMNYISPDHPDILFHLNRFNRPYGKSSSDFMQSCGIL